MTSSPEDDFLTGLLEEAGTEGLAFDWTTSDDLARRSRETLAAHMAPGRPGTSRGEMHLADRRRTSQPSRGIWSAVCR